MNRIEPGETLLAAMHNGEVHLVAAGGPSLVLGTLQGRDTMIVGSDLDVFEDAISVRPGNQDRRRLARQDRRRFSRLKPCSDVAARIALDRLGLSKDVDVFYRGTGRQRRVAGRDAAGRHGRPPASACPRCSRRKSLQASPPWWTSPR